VPQRGLCQSQRSVRRPVSAPQLKRDSLGRPRALCVTRQQAHSTAPHMCFHTRLSRPSSWHVPPFLGPNRLHARGWTRHSCSSRTPEVPLRSLCSLSDLERRGSLQTLTRHPAPCQRLPTLASGASIRHPVTPDTSNGLRFSSQRPTSPLIVSTFPTDQTRFERPAPIGSTAWVLGGLSNRMPHRPSTPWPRLACGLDQMVGTLRLAYPQRRDRSTCTSAAWTSQGFKLMQFSSRSRIRLERAPVTSARTGRSKMVCGCRPLATALRVSAQQISYSLSAR